MKILSDWGLPTPAQILALQSRTQLTVVKKTLVGSDAFCFENKVIVSLKKQPKLYE